MASLLSTEYDQMRMETLGTRASRQQSVAEYLDYVVKASQGLIEILPSVRKVIQTVEHEQVEIERIIQENKDTNPELTNEISTLTIFQSYIRDANGFRKSCLDMATYAVQEEITQAIDQDLRQGELKELKDYARILVKRLEECRHCLITTQDTARKRAQSNMDRYKSKESSYEEKAQRAEEQIEVAELDNNTGQFAAITAVGSTMGSAALGLGIFETISPKTAATLGVGGVALALVGPLLWNRKIYKKIRQLKEEVSNYRRKKRIYVSMQEHYTKILTSFDEVIQKVEELWRHKEQAHSEINRNHNFSTELSESIPISVSQRQDIQQKLKHLRPLMQCMLEELDPSTYRNQICVIS